MGTRYDLAEWIDIHDETGEYPDPLKEDGTLYSFLTILPNGEELYGSDTYEEILNELFPGYLNVTDEYAKYEMRRILAGYVASTLQPMYIDVNQEYTEDDFIALTSPKLGNDVAETETGWWHSPTPIFLVPTEYAPFTDIPRLVSINKEELEDNIRWINPETVETLMYDLHLVGFITIMQKGNPPTGNQDMEE